MADDKATRLDWEQARGQSWDAGSAALTDEHVPAIIPRVGYAGALDDRAHVVDDVVHVLGREEAGDVARGEQIVHEDEEALVRNLLVGEDCES